jgi:hypothetical protein
MELHDSPATFRLEVISLFLIGPLALLRHAPSGMKPGRRVRFRWHAGQRGNQDAIARAMASRTVMKLSGKCRSGREGVRVARSLPGGRGGKMPRTFGNDERVAA